MINQSVSLSIMQSHQHRVVFQWNLFHRRFVFTEPGLCRRADFLVRCLPACLPFASYASAWIYLVDILQVLAKRAVPRADLVLL